jgi:hypothetical protein
MNPMIVFAPHPAQRCSACNLLRRSGTSYATGNAWLTWLLLALPFVPFPWVRFPSTRFSLFALILLLALFVLIMAGTLGAQEPADTLDPVATGARALQQAARFPWYDSESDSVRDVHAVPSEADDSLTRRDGWQATAKPTRNPTSNNFNWGWLRGWGSGGWFPAVMQFLGITVLVALVVVLTWLLIRYYLRSEEVELAPVRASPGIAASERDVAIQLENLPFEMQVQHDDPLTLAQQRYEAGRYREAIVYLFAYQLVQLDRHQLIHLTRGKTNRQYLRELRSGSDLRALTEQTMLLFEEAFFGHYDVPRERFERCWLRVTDFQRMLQAGGAT